MKEDDLKLLAIGESAMFKEIGPCNPPLPKLPLQKVESLNYRTLDVENLGNAKIPHQVDNNNRERLSDLYCSLKELTELYQTHYSMESLLQTASRIVVNLLDLDHCSVGWVDENELSIRVWTSHTREGAMINTGRVHSAFSNFVKRIQSNHSNKVSSRGGIGPDRELWCKSEITAPLRVGKQIVGYICGLKSECSKVHILDTERFMFTVLSQHISVAIEAQRTREMLDCPYIALALSPKERESFTGTSHVELSFLEQVDNPEKLVKKISHRFFEDLRRAGFEAKQILSVTTEILDKLLVVLKYRTTEGVRNQ